MASTAIREIAHWIEATRVSDMLREGLWIVPTSQSIHIVAISIVFVSGLALSLKLLGIGSAERTLSALIRNLARLTFAALVVLLLTGTLQTIAEPVRQLITPAFWIKMALILLQVLITYRLARSARLEPYRWDSKGGPPAWSKVYAVVNVAVWVTVIFCGRFIGYTWMNYS